MGVRMVASVNHLNSLSIQLDTGDLESAPEDTYEHLLPV